METYRKEYAELRQKYFKENKIKAELDLELYCDWLEYIVVNKNCNLQSVMASVSDTLLIKASEYEDEANADFVTDGVQHNLNIGRYDGLMQAIQEINKHLP